MCLPILIVNSVARVRIRNAEPLRREVEHIKNVGKLFSHLLLAYSIGTFLNRSFQDFVELVANVRFILFSLNNLKCWQIWSMTFWRLRVPCSRSFPSRFVLSDWISHALSHFVFFHAKHECFCSFKV